MTVDDRPDVCPRCGAQPGEMCVTANGYTANTHAARHPDATMRGWEDGGPLRLAYETEERERRERRQREAEQDARDAEAWAARLAAVLPPFTPEEVAEVALLVAAIDARRRRREARRR